MQRVLRIAGLAGLSMLLLGSIGIAEETSERLVDDDAVAEALDEIVVVAHRHPRARRDVAANVTVLSFEDAQMELGQSIADTLRYVPGIDFETSGTRFGAESINIRGISGNRVAIRFDNVPISDHFSVGSFSNATRDLMASGLVRRIEVLHGPASAMYGSDAIGGVVSMRTFSADDIGSSAKSGGAFLSSYDGASNGTSLSAMQAFRFGDFSVAGGVARQHRYESDAAAANDSLDEFDQENLAGFANLTYDDSLGNRWRGRYYRRVGQVESALGSVLGTGRFRSTTALEGDDEDRTQIVSVELDARGLRQLDGAVIRAYYHTTDIAQRTFDERRGAARPVEINRYFSFDQQSRGVEAGFLKNFDTANVNHELSFGFDYRRRETEEYRDGVETGLTDGEITRVILGEVFPLRDFPITTTDQWGAYLEDTIAFDRWFVTAALRADYYDMQPTVDAMYAEDYPFAKPVAISASEVSPKLGAVVRLSESTEAYFQYAEGFRAPPYEDANISLELPVFNIRAVPNPNLRAERSSGFDIGLRSRTERFNAYVSLFRTDYEDFIETRVNIGVDPVSGRVLFQSQNIDQAQIEGVEAGLRTDLAPGLAFDVRLYAARGKDLTTGEALNSVGPPQAAVALDYAPEGGRWHARLRGTFTGGWTERDESAGELFQPPGHGVLDLYIAYRPIEGVTLRAGGHNLTNQTYWAWTDVGNLRPDDPTLPYLSQPGKSFTAGIDIDW